MEVQLKICSFCSRFLKTGQNIWLMHKTYPHQQEWLLTCWTPPHTRQTKKRRRKNMKGKKPLFEHPWSCKSDWKKIWSSRGKINRWSLYKQWINRMIKQQCINSTKNRHSCQVQHLVKKSTYYSCKMCLLTDLLWPRCLSTVPLGVVLLIDHSTSISLTRSLYKQPG